MMRNRRVFGSVVAVLCLGIGSSGFTQEAAQPAPSAGKAVPKAAKKGDDKIKGRLPNNYAKVGLSEEQRTKIYSIQAKYNADIEKLEKQLAELKAKEKQEIHNVLSDEQKKKLVELESAKKTTDTKPTDTRPAPAPAAPATPPKS